MTTFASTHQAEVHIAEETPSGRALALGSIPLARAVSVKVPSAQTVPPRATTSTGGSSSSRVTPTTETKTGRSTINSRGRRRSSRSS